MRKMGLVIVCVMLAVVVLAGCGGSSNNNDVKEPSAGNGYADGVYYAESEQFAESSGWKEIVALKVENGKIIDMNWNALHRDGGLDKKASSIKGHYAMVAKGGSQSEWHEQAERMEQFVLDQQTADGVKANSDGKSDAVSGVSVTVDEFASLVNKALEAGPVTMGSYKDGSYFAEAAAFDDNSGWKETVDVTVMNGRIVAVMWNGLHKDDGTDKVTRSKNGEYGMVAYGNAQAEWHEQALKAEQFLLEQQDPKAIAYNNDGMTDAVSGVSIHVNGFVELVEQALAK